MQEESRGIQSSQQEVDQKIQTESQNLSSQLCKIQRYSSIINNASTDPKHTFEQVTTAYNKDKQTLTALEERVLTLQRSVSEETGLRERLNETREEIKLSVEKLNLSNLPELPVGTSYTPALLDETSMRRDELRDSVSRVKTQLEDTTGQIIELKEFLENNKDLQEKVLEQKKTVASLENELAVVKYAVKGLESTSESLRNRVKPLVERYMSLILPLVTSGNYKAVQLDEDYTVRVFDPEAGEFKPKEVFSGGTEDQLLLAMRLAFALSLTPQAKGSNPEFLFLDEPLGSSDKVRREGIMELLRKELLQSFKQIFLISHVGDLELEADTIITMENGNVREIITRKTEPVPATASVKKSTEPVAELAAS
jgi:exonuclease SbcC